MKYIYTTLFLIIFVVGYATKVNSILNTNIQGGDFETFISASKDFLQGKSPYDYTVKSFQNTENDPNAKGYAYPPGYLYVFTTLFVLESLLKLNLHTNINPVLIYGLPFIIFHVLTTVYILKILNKSSPLLKLIAVSLWIFNPYFVAKGDFASKDMIPIFLSVASLYYLKKDSVISGALFAAAVMFKVYPIILLPIFFLESLDKRKFVAAAAIIGIAGSGPFLLPSNIKNYILGTFFVHGDRYVQGRPFLWYLRYYFKIDFIELIPFKLLAIGSLLGSWIFTGIYYLTKYKNRFIAVAVSFCIFYSLTPVLNRTYILWGIPFFSILLGKIQNKKLARLYLILLILFWVFMTWYLKQWNSGFDIWHPDIYS